MAGCPLGTPAELIDLRKSGEHDWRIRREPELAALADALIHAAAPVRVSPTRPAWPAMITVDYDTDALNDEMCYRISDYTPGS